ncbi:PP2C family serine/threonine-protein phosphatase [Cellulomonas sp. 179-A 4D5 NHS]|uniref:PP2C family protein-serine/threonine phosphatase n=1 Tax=Cellulomonas sp. 179-A 4D5 NHS TaxID=3142378 RepID=UPI00399F9E21
MTAGEAHGVRWGTATDRGSRRETNEDSHLAQFPVFAVADGMGGHEAGEVASACAVDALRALVGPETVTPDDVRAALAAAQQSIREIPVESGAPPGTTLSGVVVVGSPRGRTWLVVNLGDSRTYRWADGALERVSVDHSEVEELVARGIITPADARTHPRRHVVTRVLGGGRPDAPEPDFFALPLAAGDEVVVCTDGLTDEVPESRIAEILRHATGPQDAADRLLAAALVAGGHDNITVLVVEALPD